MLARQGWIEKGRDRYAGRRVLFVLPIGEPGGGGNVILCEAQAMREMGVEVAIFNLTANRPGFERGYPALELPVIYGMPDDVVALANEFDAVIATVNYTPAWLASITQRSGRPVRGYYVQGFEPLIYESGSTDHRHALASYTLFPDLVLFTKTEWTRQEVAHHTGAECALIGVSMDVDLFRPRPRQGSEWPERPLRVAAMVRPSTPYREPELTMQVLRQAAQRYGSGVEVLTFGAAHDDARLGDHASSFPWKAAGILSSEKVAALLNEADIFVDFSSHQAMGLTALEAMSCGAAVIVPQRGGATSFVRNEENGLVVDTASPEACWQALQRLIDERDLRTRLQARALADVCEFYPERPACNILQALFAAAKAGEDR
jgi:glycosyltransferase involved in cell wall biosynthesis